MEHQDYTRLGYFEKSALKNHNWENINDTQHKFDWVSAQIIVSVARYTTQTNGRNHY